MNFHCYVFKMHLIVLSHLRVVFPSNLFSVGFFIITVYAHHPLPHMCHIFLPSRSWLITRRIFGENSWWSVPLCDLPYSPVTSSLLDRDIFLITLFSNTACIAPWVWETKFHNRQKYTWHKRIMHLGIAVYCKQYACGGGRGKVAYCWTPGRLSGVLRFICLWRPTLPLSTVREHVLLTVWL
jgi:hypothetical protein